MKNRTIYNLETAVSLLKMVIGQTEKSQEAMKEVADWLAARAHGLSRSDWGDHNLEAELLYNMGDIFSALAKKLGN